MGRSHENSLNLIGDGDDMDLIESLESAFGIRFVNNELETVATVGGLHEVILRNLSGTALEPRRHCRSAAAFRRLRCAFKETTGEDVRPSTKVTELLKREREGYVMREVQRRANLELDAVGLSGPVVLACVATAAVTAVAWIVLWTPYDHAVGNAVIMLALTMVGSLCALIVTERTTGDRFKRLDDRTITVGDLASRAAHLNFGKLTGRDEHNHPDDVWRSLLWLCRRMTSHDRLIDRDTRIVG